MCARAETQPRGDDIFERGGVAQVGLQKLRADFVADFGDIGVRLELGNFKNQFARERIAVGVQAGGRQARSSGRRA